MQPPPPVPQSCRSLPNQWRRWPVPSSLFFLSHAGSYLSPLDDVRRKFWKGDRPSSFPFLFQPESPPSPLMTSEWDPLRVYVGMPTVFCYRLNWLHSTPLPPSPIITAFMSTFLYLSSLRLSSLVKVHDKHAYACWRKRGGGAKF